MDKKDPAAKKSKQHLDLAASMGRLQSASDEVADNRFAIAQQVTSIQPSALTTTNKTLPTGSNIQVEPKAVAATSFDASLCVVGQVYEVPIHLVDENQYGARHFYIADQIDDIGTTMASDGQDVAANGFVKNERIELFDGGTRFRAARSRGLPTLSVKIEAAPASPKDQLRRSILLNEQRSSHSCIDLAYRMNKMLSEGLYTDQTEMAKHIPDKTGKPMVKSQISMYLRIGRIPERVLQRMSTNEKTSNFTAAYAITDIFNHAGYTADQDTFDKMAEDVIDEIQSKKLSSEQAKTLIAAKLKGPKTRIRPESVQVKYGDSKGTLKVFPSRGQLDFSIKGLLPEALTELQDRIEKLCSSHP